MITFDRTSRSVVWRCTQCGTGDVCASMVSADAEAMRHVQRAHPEPSHEHMQAITASRKRRERNTP